MKQLIYLFVWRVKRHEQQYTLIMRICGRNNRHQTEVSLNHMKYDAYKGAYAIKKKYNETYACIKGRFWKLLTRITGVEQYTDARNYSLITIKHAGIWVTQGMDALAGLYRSAKKGIDRYRLITDINQRWPSRISILIQLNCWESITCSKPLLGEKYFQASWRRLLWNRKSVNCALKDTLNKMGLKANQILISI